MIHFIVVMIGGAIGSVFTLYDEPVYNKTYPSSFPFGTFAVNIIGCLVIGIIYGLTERFQFALNWRLFMATGLCGGFTTFSAFAYENIQLLQSENYLLFTMNTLGSCVFGFAAVFAGILLTRL